MNWKQEAIDKLEQYDAKKQALRSIPAEISRLEDVATRIRSMQTDGVHVRSNGGRQEDVLLNNLAQREELCWVLDQTKKWVDLVESGLCVLNEEERLVLERFFVRGEKGAADRLASDLAMDVKTVYRRKDAALRKFSIALWGCAES